MAETAKIEDELARYRQLKNRERVGPNEKELLDRNLIVEEIIERILIGHGTTSPYDNVKPFHLDKAREHFELAFYYLNKFSNLPRYIVHLADKEFVIDSMKVKITNLGE